MNVFIIGAGFTKAVFPGAPLNCKLLDALAKKDSNSASHDLQNRYKTQDIEIALTKLDADIAMPGAGEQENLTELRKRIEGELGRYFGIPEEPGNSSPCQFSVSNNLLTEKPWLADFIDKAFSQKDVAISLNYDCVLEGALDCHEKWSPNEGYGSWIEPPPDGDTYPKSPLKVLKIHGSASFQIAPYSNKPAARHVDLCFDERFFPRSAENKHGSWVGGETYLIAPSYVKIPTVEISHLMLDALQATNEAANLIIVGCSLRPEDAFLTLLHTNFLRKKSDKKIIIVGLEAKTIKGRLENYWGVNIGSCICAIPQDLENSVAELVKLISNSNSCCN